MKNTVLIRGEIDTISILTVNKPYANKGACFDVNMVRHAAVMNLTFGPWKCCLCDDQSHKDYRCTGFLLSKGGGVSRVILINIM